MVEVLVFRLYFSHGSVRVRRMLWIHIELTDKVRFSVS